MLFISIPLFIFLFVFTTGTIIGTGIFAYRTFAMQDKIIAENLLFIFLCSTLLLCICFLSVVFYSRQRRSILQRINKLVRVNGSAAIKRFGEFGKLGKYFQNFFENILDISEKRANRIVFLDNALRSVCAVSTEPFFIVNAEGNIKYVSKGFEKLCASEKNLIGAFFGDLYPELIYADIFSAVSHSRSEHIEKGEKYSFRFFPLREKQNEVSALFGIVEKTGFMAAGSETMKQLYESITGQDNTDTKKKKSKIKKIFTDLLRRE